MEIIYAWLWLAGTTFLVELGNPGLFLFLAISLGALGSAAIATATESLPLQILCFICISIISFYCLKRFVSKQKSAYVSNAHALIGAHGLVTETITLNGTGRVKIRSEEWIARSLNGASLEIGSPIQVIRIDRTTLIVSPHTHV